MHLAKLWLDNFRCYESAEFTFGTGLTAIVGGNGQGKTSLLEAVGYLATLKSLRGVPAEAMVRQGATQAIVRAEGTQGERVLLLEAEITPGGRSRIQVNRQRLPRARDLLGVFRVTVFAPDDLEMVKGGPAHRRSYCDDVLVSMAVDNHQLQADFERVLRQRNTLLRQSRGRLTPDIATTLDVWDEKLSILGDAIGNRRAQLVEQLAPVLAASYRQVADRPDGGNALVSYHPQWLEGGLANHLAAGRDEDVRRGVTQIGPHRDDLVLTIGGLPARTHASQGEQRSLALALRLAAHHLVASATGTQPLLLLDDVFSELDPTRCDALVRTLPGGQTLLTTAGALPPAIQPEHTITIAGVG